MYHFKKSSKYSFKNMLILFGIMLLTAILSIGLYILYEGIDIANYEGTTSVSQNTNSTAIRTIQTVNEIKEESTQIADMVEDVTSCVVGISKIKNAGSTIFLEDSTSSLGLGTGVIVSSDGYILSNEHVTGSKYSNCYVTLEDGRTFTAFMV